MQFLRALLRRIERVFDTPQLSLFRIAISILMAIWEKGSIRKSHYSVPLSSDVCNIVIVALTPQTGGMYAQFDRDPVGGREDEGSRTPANDIEQRAWVAW